jgi:hypothetical protein
MSKSSYQLNGMLHEVVARTPGVRSRANSILGQPEVTAEVTNRPD